MQVLGRYDQGCLKVIGPECLGTSVWGRACGQELEGVSALTRCLHAVSTAEPHPEGVMRRWREWDSGPSAGSTLSSNMHLSLHTIFTCVTYILVPAIQHALNPVQWPSPAVWKAHSVGRYTRIPLHVLCVNVPCRLWKESQVL